MISNEQVINKYKTNNKIYIPEELNNENYKYIINNNEITIITNKNCYTNYNSTYCDCIRYNEQYNIQTETYSCNSNVGNYIINYDNISSNINDSYRITRDITNDYFILYGIVIIAFIIVLTFKKNSRRI